MPLAPPPLDSRRYQELLDDTLARIPVHNPEWTNFNRSDPGVTLVELFAFLTENLLYRANQIPERNRRKFLSLLGVPLQPAASATGLVAFSNDRGPLQTITLNGGLEVRAGRIPFRTDLGLDVLPVEARVYVKRRLEDPPQQLIDYYNQLYASYRESTPPERLALYETVPLETQASTGIELQQTTDGAIWIALLLRAADRPNEATFHDVRAALGGRTLTLGFVPALADAQAVLSPARALREAPTKLRYLIPNAPDGRLPDDRLPRYKELDARPTDDVLVRPGLVQIQLPPAEELRIWENLEPLEAGAGQRPPALEDTRLADRVITWIRVQAPGGVQARLMWVGMNAATVSQRARVPSEVLPNGTGAPDQVVRLARTPIVPGSVVLRVTTGGAEELWTEIDDLLAAGPEVPVPDPRLPPGVPPPTAGPTNVFTVDAEAGEIHFGDGARGRRPPAGAILRASYDYGFGRAGNVAAGGISSSPALPAGVKVTNPVRTWGGTESETVLDGEKQVTRYLKHRDRLVNVEDFDTIARRTPGVDIGRIEVLPAFAPELAPAEPGQAPGAVTLLLIPRSDATQPDAPRPDALFLDAVCRYLDPRRLVTTEVHLRGPTYVPIWISAGIDVVVGASEAEVREAVAAAIRRFLSPLPHAGDAGVEGGWPLRKPIVALELVAVVSRVPGVRLVTGLQLARGSEAALDSIEITGLELPRLLGLSVTPGQPLALDALRGTAPAPGPTSGGDDSDEGPLPEIVPVPVVPENC
jgi:hypothetical protein